MSLPKPKPLSARADADESQAPSLRSVVRKSALLNAVIVLTSGPVLLYTGGPQAVYPTLAIMAAITVLVWTATFALFSFASLPRLFRSPDLLVTASDQDPAAHGSGVTDRWVDGVG